MRKHQLSTFITELDSSNFAQIFSRNQEMLIRTANSKWTVLHKFNVNQNRLIDIMKSLDLRGQWVVIRFLCIATRRYCDSTRSRSKLQVFRWQNLSRPTNPCADLILLSRSEGQEGKCWIQGNSADPITKDVTDKTKRNDNSFIRLLIKQF